MLRSFRGRGVSVLPAVTNATVLKDGGLRGGSIAMVARSIRAKAAAPAAPAAAAPAAAPPTSILALDPATSTGWAYFTVEEGVATLRKMGVLPVENSSPYQGDAMLSLRAQVEGVMESLPAPPDMCHIETFFFSKKFCNGSDLNLLLRGAIYQLMRERQIPYALHAPTMWKKFVAGRSRPNKGDIEKHGKTKAAKEYVKDALRDKYAIELPSYTLVNGRRRAFRHDISDAIGIGIYGIACENANVRFAPHVVTNEATLEL